jgi:hypothetical protein
MPNPQNLQEALSNQKWSEVKQEQMRALHKNNKLVFVELPNEKKAV